MNVLIIADELFASRERSLLTRLEVGLADEGMQIAHAVPESVIENTAGSAAELSGVFSKVVPYASSSMSLTRRIVVRQMVEALRELPGDFEKIDVVHVFGGGAWDLAHDIAEVFEAPLVVEVWRRGMGARARELFYIKRHAAATLFLVGEQGVERELNSSEPNAKSKSAYAAARSSAGGTLPCRVVPWGVLSPAQHRQPAEGLGKRVPANIMIIGSGRYDPRRGVDASTTYSPSWNSVLQGCAQLVHDGFDLMVYCDDLSARRANIWQQARKLNLLNRLSLISDLEGRRDLMLHGDVLVLPEWSGEQRSIVLEAMANGMITMAPREAACPMFDDHRTALLVPSGVAGAWSTAIHEVLTQRALAISLADAAHLYVQVHRKAYEYIRSVIDSYQDVAGENMKIA
jgi:hypothetical protein